MSRGFMEVSNLEGYLGKRVLVPVEGECRGEKERRGNGQVVCGMNITVQLLLDLARSTQKATDLDQASEADDVAGVRSFSETSELEAVG